MPIHHYHDTKIGPFKLSITVQYHWSADECVIDCAWLEMPDNEGKIILLLNSERDELDRYLNEHRYWDDRHSENST